MFILLSVASAIILLVAPSATSADSNLQTQLSKFRVIAEVIDASYASPIQVYLHGKLLKPGDPIPARNFKDIDILKTQWAISNNDAQHTLILLDLDRKLRPNATQISIYNLYTTVNIPGHELVRGQAIVSMEPPVVPCSPTAKHRVLMLVFHQSQTIDISDIVNIAAGPGQATKRENFNLNTFIQRHRLNLVAANVFHALGETDGICSGSTSLNSLQSLSSIVIAMVIVGTALLGIRPGRQQTIIGN